MKANVKKLQERQWKTPEIQKLKESFHRSLRRLAKRQMIEGVVQRTIARLREGKDKAPRA